jgi:hypothetical protein
MHPLFGRRFPLLSITSPPQGPSCILVVYREYMALRIPVLATNLASPRPITPTKLTWQALTDLISLAEQCEVLCPLNQPTSGDDCPQNSKNESSTTSQPSSRR